MADTRWFQIRSWHILKDVQGSEFLAWCGRRVGAATLVYDNLGSAKSCESCLRNHARATDEK